ncbi:MAG: hypothetical protein IH849_13350 [Acidobacteria bacterium]|nr:hypothetical protein [Acidobacteriota bacterium]
MRKLAPVVFSLAAVVFVLFPGGALAQSQERDWLVEVGTLFGYHGNFFFRGEGPSAPGTNLFSVYTHGEREIKASPGKFKVEFDLGAVRTGDIQNGNYFTMLGSLEFKRGPNKLSADLAMLPNRVYEEEGNGVFFDSTETEFEYRRSIAPGLWVRGKYEFKVWRFDPVQADRDSTTHKFSGGIRVPLSERAGLRGTLIYASRGAIDPHNNFGSTGFSVALEAQPTDRVQLFIRYKRRTRHYDEALLADTNFDRNDTIHDLIVNLRWMVGERWGVRVEDFYRNGNSTRLDRNYSGNRLLGGAFVVF